MEYGTTLWDPYQSKTVKMLRWCSIVLQCVSDMLDELRWPPLSQGRHEARLILFCKIINGVSQVPFGGVLIESYKGTRKTHNRKCRQMCHTTSQYGQSFSLKLVVHGTDLLSLKLRHWLYLGILFFPHNTLEGSC